jgi:hypothetical protein
MHDLVKFDKKLIKAGFTLYQKVNNKNEPTYIYSAVLDNKGQVQKTKPRGNENQIEIQVTPYPLGLQTTVKFGVVETKEPKGFNFFLFSTSASFIVQLKEKPIDLDRIIQLLRKMNRFVNKTKI